MVALRTKKRIVEDDTPVSVLGATTSSGKTEGVRLREESGGQFSIGTHRLREICGALWSRDR